MKMRMKKVTLHVPCDSNIDDCIREAIIVCMQNQCDTEFVFNDLPYTVNYNDVFRFVANQHE